MLGCLIMKQNILTTWQFNRIAVVISGIYFEISNDLLRILN